MILKEMRLAYSPGDWAHIGQFYRSAEVVSEGYDERRPVVDTVATKKIVVYLWAQPMPHMLKPLPSSESADDLPFAQVNRRFSQDVFLESGGTERKLLLLNELHAAAIDMAKLRGWSREPFEIAKASFVAGGLRAIWRSRPVWNRRRNMQALVLGEREETRTWFQVSVLDVGGHLLHASEPQVIDHHGLAEVKLRANRVRWISNSEVSVEAKALRGSFDPAYPPFHFSIEEQL